MPRLDKPRVTRPLLRLFVLLLVPVIWIGTSEAALAVPQYGDAADATWSGTDEFTPGSEIDCSISGVIGSDYTAGPGGIPSAWIDASLECGTGWNTSSSVIQSMVASGTGTCSFSPASGMGPGQIDGDPTWAGTLFMTGSIDGCAVTTLCVTHDNRVHSNPWMEHLVTECVAWNLGAPPEQDTPDSGCDFGTVTRPSVGPVRYYQHPTLGSWWIGHDVTARITGGTVPDTGGWTSYIGLQGLNGGSGVSWPGQSGVSAQNDPSDNTLMEVFKYQTAFPSIASSPHTTFVATGGPVTAANYNQGARPTASSRIVGGGAWRNSGGPAGAWDGVTVAAKLGTAVPNKGAVGKSEPSMCAFYWGSKLYNASGVTSDDPIGVLPTTPDEVPDTGTPDPPALDPEDPPASDDGTCGGASLTDPTTWIVALVCSLGRLFTPSDGFFSGQMDRVSGTWEDSSPGQYVGALSNVAPTSSASTGGCEGPAIDLDIMGTEVHGNPLKACSGVAATMASLCKLLLTVGMVVFGALACVRALGSGLGWNPGVGGSA